MHRIPNRLNFCIAFFFPVVLWICGASAAFAGGTGTVLLKAFGKTCPGGAVTVQVTPGPHTPRISEVRKDGVLIGYIVDLKVKSRSGYFRLLVAVSPQKKVLQVQVPDYPHRRGRAVRNTSFLDQFKGAAYGKPLRLGKEVDGVSGATSSANAVTGGVRQALIRVNRHSMGRK